MDPEAVKTLRVLLNNIVNNPAEEKYRGVKPTNPKLLQKLGAVGSEPWGVLRSCGFKPAGDEWRLDSAASLEPVKAALQSLEGVPKGKGKGTAPAPAKAQAAAAKAAAAVQAATDYRDQLAAARNARSARYTEEQDRALARHLSTAGVAEEDFDPISAANRTRNAEGIVTCPDCGRALRYSQSPDQEASAVVLCPCGGMRPIALVRGQRFMPIAGRPADGAEVQVQGGPILRLREQSGETMQVPLYHALQQVENHRKTEQQAASGEVINALPERTVKPGEKIVKCEICLEEMEVGAEVRTLPCFHFYHTDCVDEWLHVNRTCPHCREPIN